MRGGGVLQQQRALPQVVQDQRRQHETEPGQADRFAAEVAHVGIERLAAGHGQHHRAEHDEAMGAVQPEEANPVPGIERLPHFRRMHDPGHAEYRDGHEPDDDDRAEQSSDPMRAVLLNRKQRNQDRDGDGHDVRTEQRRHDLEAFNGAEH